MRYEYREQMVSYGFNTSKLLQNSGTRLPQLMNTSGFHQNVGEGNKLSNAMSPAFGKGSGYHKAFKLEAAQPECSSTATMKAVALSVCCIIL